jgi:hypothetical protein
MAIYVPSRKVWNNQPKGFVGLANNPLSGRVLYLATPNDGRFVNQVRGDSIVNPGGLSGYGDKAIATFNGSQVNNTLYNFNGATNGRTIVAARIRATATQSATPGVAFSHCASTAQATLGVGFDTSNNVGAAILNGNGASLPVYSSGQLNTWYTVFASTSTTSNYSVKSWINGVPAAVNQGVLVGGSFESGDEITFGGAHRSSGFLRQFKGDIEWAAILDWPFTVFTDQDAANLYQSGFPYSILRPRRSWFYLGDSTLRIPFTKSSGSTDNINLEAGNAVRFIKSDSYTSNIPATTE